MVELAITCGEEGEALQGVGGRAAVGLHAGMRVAAHPGPRQLAAATPCRTALPPNQPNVFRTCSTATWFRAYMLGMAGVAARRRPLAMAAVMLTSTTSVPLTVRLAACRVACTAASSWPALVLLQGDRLLLVSWRTSE